MRTALVLMLSVVAIPRAQEHKSEVNSDLKKRMASVTWDIKSHKLIWEVQKGSVVEGEFVAGSSEKYEISPDDAVMAVEQEKRGFTTTEAAALHRLLDTLSLYCAESVVWWDQGQGVKLDPDGKPDPAQKDHHPDTTGPDRQRVEELPRPERPQPLSSRTLRIAMRQPAPAPTRISW